jgi:hypothetical protein
MVFLKKIKKRLRAAALLLSSGERACTAENAQRMHASARARREQGDQAGQIFAYWAIVCFW